MNWIIRIIAFIHMLLYMGIMWWGWQSYKLLQKRSWLYMGVGFGVLLIFRTEQFYALMTHSADDVHTGARLMWETFTPFIGAGFLILSFWRLSYEHQKLIDRLRSHRPTELSAGDQPVEFWEGVFRKIVSEEVAKIKLKSV